jgi:hypothetical protein
MQEAGFKMNFWSSLGVISSTFTLLVFTSDITIRAVGVSLQLPS